MDIPTNEPLELRAGTTWKWTRDFSSNYPANDGWTLKYWFKKTGTSGANFSVDATPDGTQFAVTVAIATTATLTPGDYTWVAQATKAGEIYDADSGKLKILPRYDAAANLDDRSHNVKMLEAINACLENRASSTQREMVAYTIGIRSKTFDVNESKAALVELKSKYEWFVYDEEGRAAMSKGEPNPRTVNARFT